MIKTTSKYYWFCQIFGWSIVGMTMLFFGYIFSVSFNGIYLGRIATFFAAGIISTHLLRAFIKKMNWFTLPIEKIILKLIIAGILTSFVFAIFQTGFFKIFNLFGGKKLDVFVRILTSLVNAMNFIITWTMIYYFFHYYQKTAKEQIQNRRLQRLLSKKESDFEKSTVDVHFIENSLEKIKILIDSNPIQARKAITDFSNLLRTGHLNPEK